MLNLFFISTKIRILKTSALSKVCSAHYLAAFMAILGSSFIRQAASGLNQWWVYLLGVLSIGVGVLLGQIPLGLVLRASDVDIASGQLYADHIDKNLTLVLLLLPFAVGLAATMMVMTRLHMRSAKSVFTARPRFSVRRCLGGAAIMLALTSLSVILDYQLDPDTYTWRGMREGYAWLMVISLVMFPLQVAFEEVFMRGYLLQAAGLGFRHTGGALVVSTAIFALGHMANPEVAGYGWPIMLSYYMLSGLFLAIVTIMDDGLELAIGIHFATNFFSATILGYEHGAIQTDALMMTEIAVSWPSLAGTLVSFAIVLILLRYLYRWPSWTKLWQPIGLAHHEDGSSLNHL